LYILVTEMSKSPSVLDSENRRLTLRCGHFLTALATAMPRFSCGHALEMTGAHDSFGVRIRQAAQIKPLSSSPSFPRTQLTEGDIQKAFAFVTVIEDLAAKPGSPLAIATRVFVDAMQTSNPPKRLHEFVRCVEGIVHPSIGRTRLDFVERVGSVMKGDIRGTLEKIYDIRSADEHLKEWRQFLPGSDDVAKQRVLETRVLQAEAIARHFLTRVFEDSRLRALLESRSAAEVFWEARDTALWGMPLDLEVETGHLAPAST
jgi:hypothetical protein